MQSPPSYSHSVTLHARSQVRSPTQLGRQPAAHSPNFASDFSTAQPPAYRKPNSHEHVASVCVHETSSGESADGSHMRTKWTLDRIMRPPRSIRGERSLPHAEPL